MKNPQQEIFAEFINVLKQEADPSDLQELLAGGDLKLAPGSNCSPELARAIGEVVSFLVSTIPANDLL